MAYIHRRLFTVMLFLTCPWSTGVTFADVRTEHLPFATLVAKTTERSHTFRTLLSAIDAANGIVYLTPGRCGRLRACLAHRITTAGRHRVLTIVLDPAREDVALVTAIAHELQHAAEVLAVPHITTDEEMFAFYWMHGIEMRGALETRAAIEAGDAVRRELRR